MYQFTIGCGLLMGVVVDMQTSKRNDSGSYRISMAMQYLFPLILVPGLIFWMPESPRWLIENNKSSKAERSLQKLKGPGQEEEVAAELAYLQASNDAYQPTSWSSIWTNKAERRKAYLGFAIQALQQASWNQFYHWIWDCVLLQPEHRERVPNLDWSVHCWLPSDMDIPILHRKVWSSAIPDPFGSPHGSRSFHHGRRRLGDKRHKHKGDILRNRRNGLLLHLRLLSGLGTHRVGW